MPLAIDAHAHVFTDNCRPATTRRYTPSYEAPLSAYMAVLDELGAAGGVLVQPSFLGTDNSYLLACLDAEPDRLRGIAVVDPDVSDETLDDMAERHVVGLRLNYIVKDSGWRPGEAEDMLSAKAAKRNWQVEVQARGPVLAALLDFLVPRVDRVVIDHFGLPMSADPACDPGFASLLNSSASGRVWVKMSAPYRFAGAAPVLAGARLLSSFGAERLLWGSDWPWTQHEQQMDLKRARAWPFGIVPPQYEAAIFDRTARDLFGFAAL